MLWSVSLAMLSILSVVRAQALEPLFGGLDAAVRLHRRLGLAALLMMGVHAILLVADAVARGRSLAARARALLVKGRGPSTSSRSMRSPSRHPRLRPAPAPRALAGIPSRHRASVRARHAPRGDEPGTIHAYEPLRTWMVIPLLVGGVAWTYRVLLFTRFGPRYRYQVEAVVPRGAQTIDLVMRPLDRRMMYEPGTFVFIRVPSFKGMERELHPFSISSSPLDRTCGFPSPDRRFHAAAFLPLAW